MFYTNKETARISDFIPASASGIFRSEMNSELQLPNNIIQIIKTDDGGNIYFFTSCINLQASSLEKKFYSSIEFFDKRSSGRTILSGVAEIVNKDEALFSKTNYSPSVSNQIVFVKMHVKHAEVTLPKSSNESSIWNCAKTIWSNWFTDELTRSYNFS